MNDAHRREPAKRRRTPWERAPFGVAGAAVVAGALWLTAVAAFMTFPDCGGPNSRDVVVDRALGGVVATLLITPVWVGALSLFRVAAGREALRTRSWLLAPLVFAALAFVVYEDAFENEPPPSATCQPFEMS